MLNLKVMFFAHDPGGANAIAPLVPCFPSALVFGKGPALNLLPNAQELPPDALKSLRPDFLITGTSANDFTERHLWTEAKELGIKSMAILDLWCNYGIRFSAWPISEKKSFDKKCEFLPSYICVMDEFAKAEMAADGVPSEIILPFGNPHFEHVASRRGQTKILYASSVADTEEQRVMEEVALADLVSVAQEMGAVELKIRKHPRESMEKFGKYLNRFRGGD
jgi:hypothetical protein